MYENLQQTRELTGTPAFQQAVHGLAGRVWPTAQLKMVEADIRRLHQQVADTLNADEPWGAENRKASRGLVIVGPNGSSKSFSIEYALASLPPVALKTGQLVPAKILYREAPQGEARGWLRDVLAVLGYGMARLPAPELAMSVIESRMRRSAYTIAAFDEVSRVLNSRNFPSKKKLAAQAEVVWSQMIQIMSDPVWPTPVIVSGTLELLDTLELVNPRTGETVARGDMNRRSDITTLPPLDMADADALEAYLDQYCQDAGVTNRTSSKDEVGRRLVNASRRSIGTALSYAQWAVASAAMRRRGALHVSDLAQVLAIRASIPADANLFLLDNWEEINFEKVAPANFEDARYHNDVEEAY